MKTRILLIAFLVLSMCGITFAQDEEKGVLLNVVYQRDHSAQVVLTATIVDEEEEEPVSGAVIKFYTLADSLEVLLGAATANEEGVAVLSIQEDKVSKAADGLMEFAVRFEGNDTFGANKETASWKDLEMEINFVEEDEQRNIEVSLMSWDDEGNKIPVPEMDVYLFAPRMFSQLPIGEIWIEEDGKGRVAFPEALPGDDSGNIQVLAKITDSDEYGNYASFKSIDWGIAVSHEAGEIPRSLWSPSAPIWMQVTFIILMSGVWYHFFLVIYKLWRIKDYGKNEEKIIWDIDK